MRRTYIFLIGSFFLLFCTFSVTIPSVYAQAPTSSYTMTVSPSVVHLDLAHDQPQTVLTYTNTSSVPITLTFSAEDVQELDQDYHFPPDKNHPSEWLILNESSVTLLPETSQSLTILINETKLSPGGHYASVVAQVHPVQQQTGNVTIQGALVTYITVRTHTGQEKDQAKIIGFTPEFPWWILPTTFVLKVENTGNTQLIPYGTVDITKADNQIVARGVVNSGSLVVIPGSTRRYTLPIRNMASIIFPGIYKAHVTLHVGDTPQIYTQSSTLFTLGSGIVILPCIGIGIIGLLCIHFCRRSLHKKE